MTAVLDRPAAEPADTDRPFHVFWLGEGVSLLGSAVTSTLLPLLAVVRLGAGPAWMGAITAAVWAPWLVIGLPAGAWIDRLDPRRVLLRADLLSAAALASVPVTAAFGVLTLGQLVLVALVTGCAAVFFQTAFVPFVAHVVPERRLETANARLFGTQSAAQIAGPAFAALLVAAVGSAAGLLVDAVSFLVSAACLVLLGRLLAPARDAHDRPAREPLRRRIAEGVTIVVHDRAIRAFTVAGGVSNFGLTGYQTLLLLYLVHDLGVGAGAVGLLLAVCGIGGVLGAAVAPRIAGRYGSGRASSLFAAVGALAAIPVGLPTGHGGVAVTVAGLAGVAAGVVAGNVVRAAWRQRYVPRELMGRVVTASQLVNFGTMPLAALAAGVLGSHLGIRPAILLLAGVHTLAMITLALSPLGRLRELPAGRCTP